MRDCNWYCPCCDAFLYQDEVTGDKQDERCGQCGTPVQTKPDPEEM